MVEYYKEEDKVFASVEIDVSQEVKLIDSRIEQFQNEINALNLQKEKLLSV